MFIPRIEETNIDLNKKVFESKVEPPKKDLETKEDTKVVNPTLDNQPSPPIPTTPTLTIYKSQTSNPQRNIFWEYLGKKGIKLYSRVESNQIEAAYTSKQTNICLTASGATYKIDFSNMTQKRNSSNNARKIGSIILNDKVFSNSVL